MGALNKGHFAQVKKAVGTYTGIEPVTVCLKGKCSTDELVCKLFQLCREV